MSEGLDFAAELARLEEIVRRLEADDTDLDEALRLFDEGVERLRRAQAQLTAAEATVKQVLAERGGALRLGPLDS